MQGRNIAHTSAKGKYAPIYIYMHIYLIFNIYFDTTEQLGKNCMSAAL